jgi:hypothetical protein
LNPASFDAETRVEREIKDLKDFKALRGYRLRDPLESLVGVLCLVANAVQFFQWK